MKRALIVIAQKNFQDKELEGTKKGLEEAGFTITICSKEEGECIGKFRVVEEAEVALRQVDVRDFDRFAFIGGPGAAGFVQDLEAFDLVRAITKANKPLGAICIAPTILAAAGVLRGKRATVWDDGNRTQIGVIEGSGATYTGEFVTVDGLLVTGNGPAASEEFGKALAAL